MTKTAATTRGPSGASPAQTPLTAGALGYRQNLRSLDRSHGFEPLRIEGEIPRDLRGTLYRNGPASFERFGLRYRHWFDGDGAVSAVRFADGRAEGAVRMVAPTGSREEEKRGRALHGGYGTADPGWRPGFLAGAQRNAALGLGMKPRQVYVHVVLPQVLRAVFLPITNQIVWAMLGTSLGMIIGLQDLTGMTTFLQSQTFRPFEFYLAAALIYLIICETVLTVARITARLAFRW